MVIAVQGEGSQATGSHSTPSRTSQPARAAATLRPPAPAKRSIVGTPSMVPHQSTPARLRTPNSTHRSGRRGATPSARDDAWGTRMRSGRGCGGARPSLFKAFLIRWAGSPIDSASRPRGDSGLRAEGRSTIRLVRAIAATSATPARRSNDFTSEGGALHGAVQGVMDDSGTLANTQRVVDEARKAGATVIQAPITFAPLRRSETPTTSTASSRASSTPRPSLRAPGAPRSATRWPRQGDDIVVEGKRGADTRWPGWRDRT